MNGRVSTCQTILSFANDNINWSLKRVGWHGVRLCVVCGAQLAHTASTGTIGSTFELGRAGVRGEKVNFVPLVSETVVPFSASLPFWKSPLAALCGKPVFRKCFVCKSTGTVAKPSAGIRHRLSWVIVHNGMKSSPISKDDLIQRVTTKSKQIKSKNALSAFPPESQDGTKSLQHGEMFLL